MSLGGVMFNKERLAQAGLNEDGYPSKKGKKSATPVPGTKGVPFRTASPSNPQVQTKNSTQNCADTVDYSSTSSGSENDEEYDSEEITAGAGRSRNDPQAWPTPAQMVTHGRNVQAWPAPAQVDLARYSPLEEWGRVKVKMILPFSYVPLTQGSSARLTFRPEHDFVTKAFAPHASSDPDLFIHTMDHTKYNLKSLVIANITIVSSDSNAPYPLVLAIAPPSKNESDVFNNLSSIGGKCLTMISEGVQNRNYVAYQMTDSELCKNTAHLTMEHLFQSAKGVNESIMLGENHPFLYLMKGYFASYFDKNEWVMRDMNTIIPMTQFKKLATLFKEAKDIYCPVLNPYEINWELFRPDGLALNTLKGTSGERRTEDDQNMDLKRTCTVHVEVIINGYYPTIDNTQLSAEEDSEAKMAMRMRLETEIEKGMRPQRTTERTDTKTVSARSKLHRPTRT